MFIVSTKCSKNCQRYLWSQLRAVKSAKDIIAYTKCSKTCQRYLWSQLSAVKSVKDIYCLH